MITTMNTTPEPIMANPRSRVTINTTSPAKRAITPESIIYTAQLDAFSAQFSRSAGAGIGWSPTGPGSVDVQFLVFSADGSQTLGSIVCREWDDGYMIIPANVLQPYPAGSAMAIYVHRTEYTESVIPNNGHTLQSVAQMGVLGTGIISP